MPNRPRDPEYRAGMAADRLRRRAERHIAAGRADRAVAVLDHASDLVRARRNTSPLFGLLDRELYPLTMMAEAAAAGQDTIRRELVSHHTTAAGDLNPDGYRMQA